jgi:hypothetical protein
MWDVVTENATRLGLELAAHDSADTCGDGMRGGSWFEQIQLASAIPQFKRPNAA